MAAIACLSSINTMFRLLLAVGSKVQVFWLQAREGGRVAEWGCGVRGRALHTRRGAVPLYIFAAGLRSLSNSSRRWLRANRCSRYLFWNPSRLNKLTRLCASAHRPLHRPRSTLRGSPWALPATTEKQTVREHVRLSPWIMVQTLAHRPMFLLFLKLVLQRARIRGSKPRNRGLSPPRLP